MAIADNPIVPSTITGKCPRCETDVAELKEIRELLEAIRAEIS